MNPSTIQLLGAVLFAVAILHTFSTRYFERLAQSKATHAGIWHLLGEVEVVFGFWALILVLCMLVLEGRGATTAYIDSRNYTEPMFVFAIMVIAGTRPVLECAKHCISFSARLIPLPRGMAYFLAIMIVVPLLGSLITEPAAMTLAALLLRDRYFSNAVSARFKYAVLGVLFVNISVGGTLTSFAAPPVLMVAGKWGWDSMFMLTNFGWQAALTVILNTTLLMLLFRRDLKKVRYTRPRNSLTVPFPLIVVHLLFLLAVVVFAHHPAIFMGLLLFFLGVTQAYERYQDRLILREGLLVAFFLAGLVVLGGVQQWWLQPLLMNMSSDAVFWGAAALTAFTDNAALTYLGSLVEGLSPEFKHALVAGAVTGGGLTVIANAPNPAGLAMLHGKFDDGVVRPGGLFLAALPPTLLAAMAFQLW